MRLTEGGSVPAPLRGAAALYSGRTVLFLASAALVAFLVLPVLALFLEAGSPGTVASYLGEPVVTEALRLSLLTSAATLGLAVALGTPAAYVMARYRFPGRDALDTLLDLPLVLPPAVAGIALLMAFGRQGLLGGTLEAAGVEVAFTTAAVVLAQLFVSVPFYLRAARAGFLAVDRELEQVSATLGVSGARTFLRVTVPLALPSLLGGAVMAWARALGEFGATIMFAGSLPGRTQTMPLAIYSAMVTDLDAALVLAVILVAVSFAVLLAFRAVLGRGVPRYPYA
jgi:molybdate transport system permease protein